MCRRTRYIKPGRQASTSSLQKNGKGLGRTQKQNVGHLGDIDPFVENVNGADHFQRIILVPEPAYNFCPVIIAGFTRQGNRRNPVIPLEMFGRVARVCDRVAEGERLAVALRHAVVKFVNDNIIKGIRGKCAQVAPLLNV